MPPLTRRLAAILIALVPCAAGAAPPPTVEGEVRHVTDGDTLVLRAAALGARPIKLRLIGLDAPEICQPGGIAARDALAGRVAGRRVVASGAVRDDYGRRLVTLWLDGEDVGAWLVLEGHAWNLSYRGRAGRYAEQERAARAARRGVFAAGDAVPPRTFRRLHGACR